MTSRREVATRADAPRSAMSRNAAAEQRLRRGRPEQHENLGTHDVELGEQPRPACLDLLGVGLLVDATLAALLEAEVLDGVRDVRLRAVDAGRLERPVEFATGRADERPPLAILAVAGHLADEDERRVLGSLAEHGLRGGLPQVAAAAAAGGLAQRIESERSARAGTASAS